MQKCSTDSFKTIRLSPSTLLYFLVAFQDVVSKTSSHVSEFQEREMKGKQDIGGKMFSLSRCWKWQTNAGEARARLSREQLRSLLTGERLWGWWRGEGRANASRAWTKRTFSSFKYFKVMLRCSTALRLTYPCNPIYVAYPQEPEACSNFLKFVQFLRWVLLPTTCLNYCLSPVKLVLSWIHCTSVTTFWISP